MVRPNPAGRVPTVLVPVLFTVVLGCATAVAWRSADRSTPAPVAAVTAPLAGSDIFRAKGCATCHDGPGRESRFDIGPNLTNLPSVAEARDTGLTATEYVRRSITDPGAFVVPGYQNLGMNAMPALAVSPAEIDALIDYLLAAR